MRQREVINSERFYQLPPWTQQSIVDVGRYALEPRCVMRSSPASRGQDRWFIRLEGRALCCQVEQVLPRSVGEPTMKQARHARTRMHVWTWAWAQLWTFSDVFAQWCRSLATEHIAGSQGVAQFLLVAASGVSKDEHETVQAFIKLLEGATYERRRHLMKLVQQQCRVSASGLWDVRSKVDLILSEESERERKKVASIQGKVDQERAARKRRGMLIEMD